ncbi:MAG: phosphodiester glycosidase family protein [Sphingobacterium sp.]
MKKTKVLYYFLFLFLLISCGKDNDGTQLPYDYTTVEEQDLTELLERAEWKSQELADGLTWRHVQFSNIFDSRQYINLFEVDLTKGLELDVPYVESGFLKTSEAGEVEGALAAWNGSYFNTSTGGSTVFFKSDGLVLNQTVSGFNTYRENGAFVIDGQGKSKIVQKPASGWDAVSEPTVLAGGPLLMMDGEELAQLDVAFNANRHPRTAVGITAGGKMVVAVVDGRSAQSQGLTIPQLSALMKALGCTHAVNLDGGGSTTAWVQELGVVNYPSDNGKFDHQGERGVATVITVK